jgi:hypothetical protein
VLLASIIYDPLDYSAETIAGKIVDVLYGAYDAIASTAIPEGMVIDLNHDGKVSTSSGTRYFDVDGNGFLEQMKWAAPGDGLLVMDRDGDGKITTGKELDKCLANRKLYSSSCNGRTQPSGRNCRPGTLRSPWPGGVLRLPS